MRLTSKWERRKTVWNLQENEKDQRRHEEYLVAGDKAQDADLAVVYFCHQVT